MPTPSPVSTPQTAQFEARLSEQVGQPVELVTTRNRRRLVSVQRHPGRVQVRLHEGLLLAPDHVQQAVAQFVMKGCRSSGRTIRTFLATQLPDTPPRPINLRAEGDTHHLAPLLDAVADHFPQLSPPAITWGPRRKPGARHVRLGSYDPKRQLIRINPLLDHPNVPVAVVRFVVYHEMVHHALNDERAAGAAPHDARFVAMERRCPDWHTAQQWQQRHLATHLRNRRRSYR